MYLPPAGRSVLNMLDLSGPTHPRYGLLEVDMAHARLSIAEQGASGGVGANAETSSPLAQLKPVTIGLTAIRKHEYRPRKQRDKRS